MLIFLNQPALKNIPEAQTHHTEHRVQTGQRRPHRAHCRRATEAGPDVPEGPPSTADGCTEGAAGWKGAPNTPACPQDSRHAFAQECTNTHQPAGRRAHVHPRAAGQPPSSWGRVQNVSCLRDSQAALGPRGLGLCKAAPSLQPLGPVSCCQDPITREVSGGNPGSFLQRHNKPVPGPGGLYTRACANLPSPVVLGRGKGQDARQQLQHLPP